MMKETTLDIILKQEEVSRAEKVRLVLSMSLPAILAQLTSIAMQYIDAGMVGSMGANATASIGLVSSTTWLIGGSCIGLSAGFYVQIAQLIGAGRDSEAENVLRQGLKTVVVLGILISVLCYAIGGSLPRWLGGDREIWSDSSAYFRVYCLSDKNGESAGTDPGSDDSGRRPESGRRGAGNDTLGGHYLSRGAVPCRDEE